MSDKRHRNPAGGVGGGGLAKQTIESFKQNLFGQITFGEGLQTLFRVRALILEGGQRAPHHHHHPLGEAPHTPTPAFFSHLHGSSQLTAG